MKDEKNTWADIRALAAAEKAGALPRTGRLKIWTVTTYYPVRVPPNTKHQTPTTQHPTPNTQHPTPNTQHQTPPPTS